MDSVENIILNINIAFMCFIFQVTDFTLLRTDQMFLFAALGQWIPVCPLKGPDSRGRVCETQRPVAGVC